MRGFVAGVSAEGGQLNPERREAAKGPPYKGNNRVFEIAQGEIPADAAIWPNKLGWRGWTGAKLIARDEHAKVAIQAAR
ncbi:hypothetical protein [Paracoccus aerodenitrificans]|uniref:hypothetical protein n=1 Tax=Paracoccus aerodenitrificans TaxID=3017781 RepID=UPI0022F02581|nr:hypothetical protein [Paracoccus aerodenitrificans]WBU64543.1 hypothetical protein PAE61_03595 [Paracoccus aerodenitrificans]